LATSASQVVSAALVVIYLMKREDACRLVLRHLHIYPDKLMSIVRVGLPAGLQGAVFSISNVLIQSSVNSFGSVAVAGNTAAANLEGFVYNAMNSFHQTALSFTSQNMGARKFDRVKKIMWICVGCVTATGAIMGGAGLFFADTLLSLYSTEADVIAYGHMRLLYILSLYFLCGVMDVLMGSIRGMGYSIMPMVVSLIGACGLRVVWIFTVFQWFRSLGTLYISYPITWTVTLLVHFICFRYGIRKIEKHLG
jgi:Na+-driven multidrug efflux pump